MSDITNATSEGAASPSPNDVGATGAGGVDAVAETQAVSQDGLAQTTPTTGVEGISAGWSLEDQPEEPSAVPENDDDIPGMLNDPNLDQSKTPKLVADLRGARAEARQYKAELKQLRANLQQLEEYGGLEAVGQTLSDLKNLIHNPQEGVLPFLRNLAAGAMPAYWQVIDTLVEYESDNLIAKLQAAGKLPDTFEAPRAALLTDEDWARIPKELHAVAAKVPPAQLIEWLDKGSNESLIYNLEREAQLQRLSEAQAAQAEQQWRSAVERAQQQARESIEKLSDQYEQAHYAELAKWKPLGPESEQDNQIIYRMTVEGALADLLADPKYLQMYNDAQALLGNAPLRRLRNEALAADADERKARQLAMQFNARLGQMLRDRVRLLDSVFRDARAYRESQHQQVPQRREIAGSSVNGGARSIPTLDANGRISKAYLEHLVNSIPD